MRLERTMLSANKPCIPQRLQSRITFLTTCHLTNNEIMAFEVAFQALDSTMAGDTSIPDELGVTVIVTDQDTISLTILNPNTMGLETGLVIYPIHRWRIAHYNQACMIVCCVEELCHHFWSIANEERVRGKVLDVLKYIWPNVRSEDVYRPF